MSDGLARRDFLKVVGVGGAGAAVAGCSTDKVERLIPYVTPPEEITPGVATWYASTCGECGSGCGIRVRTREGRAVMIEGNPDHPVSRGGVCSRGVSALQGLYNPDRVATPLRATGDGFEAIAWDEALELLADRLGTGGRSVFLTGRKGPAAGRLLDGFVDAVGGDRVIYDPLDDSALRAAVDIAFGVSTLPRYDIAAAKFLVSFGADFLETWISPVRFAADFAGMHAVDHGEKGRFVFVGPRLSLTGQNADEWIPARAGTEARIALALAGELVRRGADAGPYSEMASRHTLEDAAREAGIEAEALAALADRFASGPALALGPGLAGHHQGATAANLAVLILNMAAGSLGRTLHIASVPDTEASSYTSLSSAIDAMRSGTYGVGVVSGTNPAYSLPPGSGFADAFTAVPFKVAFATALDETSALADLVLPDAHPLESWGDGISSGAPEGTEPQRLTYAVRQPVMRPLPMYDSRPMSDVLLDTGRRLGHDFGAATFHGYLRAAHDGRLADAGSTADPDTMWRELLRAGSIGQPDVSPPVTALRSPTTSVDFAAPSLRGDDGLTLLVHPSPRFGDGTHSNRPWLQELPDPVAKVMWQSWVEMNPATAERLGLRTGDMVRVATEQGEVELRAWAYPGIREDAVAIAMGGGHTSYGRFADGNGVNPRDAASRGGRRDLRDPGPGVHACVGPRDGSLAPARHHGRVERPGRPQRGPGGGAVGARTRGGGSGARAARPGSRAPGGGGLPAGRDRGTGRGLPAAGFGFRGVRRGSSALGDGHRPGQVQRLRRLRDRLPGRKQHPLGRRDPDDDGPRDALAAPGAVLRDGGRVALGAAGHPLPADALPALQQRALRAGLPGPSRRTTPPTG